jgi:hypothetical protein
MQAAHETLCQNFLVSGKDIECRKISNGSGSFTINYIPILDETGVVYFFQNDKLEFLEVSDGQIFFYEQMSGGMENSVISARKLFCISTQAGNRGYAWDGSKYKYHQEATEACPIGQEEWPWVR